MTRRLLPALALLMALPASAQHTQAGVQASVVFPQSDLRTNAAGALGLDVGVHVVLDLQGGSELRPRLDYLQCDTEAFHAISFSSTTRTVHAVTLGVDYLRYFDQGNRGLYGVVGVGAQWWSASDAAHGDTHDFNPGISFGAGFRFNSSLAAEITYNIGKFRSNSGTAGSVQMGLNYRF